MAGQSNLCNANYAMLKSDWPILLIKSESIHSVPKIHETVPSYYINV